MSTSALSLHVPKVTTELLYRARRRLLQMHYESHVGHIGGNLSCLDILLALYHDVLGPDDMFVLSKGHAAGALYVALWSIGALKDEDLRQFHADGTRFGGHPPASGVPEIPFGTGSLGHGLGLAAGLALGKKLKGEKGRAFCLMSDGEWNEGSNWEALIFIQHRQIDNLTLIVDLNGLQGLGRTCDIADLKSLSDKFRSFGLHTVEVDGHNPTDMAAELMKDTAGPRAIIARTRKGGHVSFMEDRFEWHYLPMNEDQYSEAIRELNDKCVVHSAAHS
jgi:transketolase